MARREERAYREYVSDEQRSQPGCPARELCDESLLRDTREVRRAGTSSTKNNQPRRTQRQFSVCVEAHYSDGLLGACPTNRRATCHDTQGRNRRTRRTKPVCS